MPERIYVLLTFTFQRSRKYRLRHPCRDVENNRQNLPLRGKICRVAGQILPGRGEFWAKKKERLGWFRPLRPIFSQRIYSV
jgi:hypothetical protein